MRLDSQSPHYLAPLVERPRHPDYWALKPGGTLVVVDHLAPAGGGVDAADKLHRMDQALALAALTEAGFELEEESDLYARPEDPHTASVFDESIAGKTDQFTWRLRKPE